MNFTQNWIDNKGIVQYWEKYLSEFKGKPINMLEIGSFEGRSTVWFLENILTHQESSINCIDTFSGDQQAVDMNVSLKGVKERFLENTKKYINKVFLTIKDSQSALKTIQPYKYDLIYIDGSHYQTDVLHDAVLCWDILKKDGILIFDDYGMEFIDANQRKYNPKLAIDSFIKVYEPHLKILHTEWQMIIKKID